MTNRPSLHLCIATGQNLPNLIPALQLRAFKVVVLETTEMRTSADKLQAALVDHGIEVVRQHFDDQSPEAIAASAVQIGKQFSDEAVIFNFTGGHKLMTLGVAEVMEKSVASLHLLYAETRHQRLDWLKPEPAMQEMEDVLQIDDFLVVQGYRRTKSSDSDGYWQAQALARAPLTLKLGNASNQLANLFGSLNKLAQQAMPDPAYGRKNFQPEQHFDKAPFGPHAEALTLANELHLLTWDQSKILHFASEETASYIGGGWLEEFAWLNLRALKPFDSAVNLMIESAGSNVSNELDVVVAHRNRMLVVECKTLRFGRDAMKDAAYIYKLAQLSKQVGGAMAGSLLLSARAINPDVVERAQQYGVQVLAGADIRNFSTHVLAWMNA